MRAIKVYLADGNDYTTSINGTNKEIEEYFVGKILNIGSGAEDYLVKCIRVEFLK